MSAPADIKWLDGLTPDMRVGKAARLALASRLQAVRDAVGPAAELSADPEPIHELRVATRRGVAALTVFGSRVPAKLERRTRKNLRRLRRSAAPAREADVFLTALDAWAPGRPNVEKPGLQFLFGHVSSERRASQQGVNDAIADCDGRWTYRLERCVQSVRRGGPSLAEFGVPYSADLARRFDAAALAATFDHAERMHALRIAAKKLRYSFELLGPALPSVAWDTVYPMLSDVQRILGIANDCWQAIGRLDQLLDDVTALHPQSLPSIRAGINAFRTMQREQVSAQRAAFSAWRSKWTSVRNVPFVIQERRLGV
jgi:CHAD domain-containing protein